MAKPKSLRISTIETNRVICNVCCGFLVIVAIVYTCELWYTRASALNLKDDSTAVNISGSIPASSPAAIIQNRQSLGIQGRSTYRLQKRAPGGKKKNQVPKKGATRQTQTQAGAQVAQPSQNPTAAALAAELARYQALLVQKLAADKEEEKEAQRRKAEWNDIVWKALREQAEPYEDDRPLFYAIENRLFNPPSLLGPEGLWNGEDVFNDVESIDRLAVFPKKYKPPKGRSLFDEDDINNEVFIKQVEDFQKEDVGEQWHAVEVYNDDEEESSTGGILLPPYWEIREWQEEQVVEPPKEVEEQTGKLPKGVDEVDTSLNSARLGSTASQTLSTVEGDSSDRQGLGYMTRIPSQGFNLGVIESDEGEAEEELAHGGLYGPDVYEVEPILSVMKGMDRSLGLKAAPVNTAPSKLLIDETGFIPTRNPNVNRIGKEMNANDRYNAWANAWKGPIFPRTEKDWKDPSGPSSLIPPKTSPGDTFSTEWKNANKNDYGLGLCSKRSVEYYGKMREASWCPLKKS
ncbi:hypothetical protein AA313_de0208861 [Arthrobotrys entomopaga]|nr:hypothetical protein AA313_de0208861 [Arthrobotrys entomopaga]